jgi:hypothetical protein
MNSKRKIWLGVGAFMVAGTGAIGPGVALPAEAPAEASAKAFLGLRLPSGLATATAIPRAAGIVVAEHAEHDKAGEGGEGKGIANLPPELAFGVRIALLRGHLLIGDELVRQRQWNAALPHFLHPIEEIYGDIKDHLADHKAPPFDAALKALSDLVKARKGGADYTRALKAVTDALAAADAGMKEKQADWAGFVTEAAIESIKTAGGEYENALVAGKIAKPVEYQDARGFIRQADRMIGSVAAALQRKDATALREVRAGLDDLKRIFPAAMPPRTPVKDHAAMLAIIARIELAAGKLM